MREERCRHFWGNGSPYKGGCRDSRCDYVHPEDKGWASLPPFKAMIRCRHFDNRGIPLGICRDGRRECRFVHPEDPLWDHAESSNHAEIFRSRPFPSHSARATTRPGHSDPPPRRHSSSYDAKDTVRTFPRRPIPRAVSGDFTSPSRSIDSSLSKLEDSTPATNRSDKVSLVQPSSSVPGSSEPMWTSPEVPTKTSHISLSKDLQIVDDPSDSDWKTLTSSLVQAVDLLQQMRDLQSRKSLRLDDETTPSSLDKARTLNESQDEANKLEDKFSAVVTEIMEKDVWPLPKSAAFHTEQGALSDAQRNLKGRLDEIEAQVKERAKMRAVASQNIERSGTTADNSDVIGSSLRSPRQHQAFYSDPRLRIPSINQAMNRLDNVEEKISEMEETEVWRDEGFEERIEKIVEENAPKNKNKQEDYDGGFLQEAETVIQTLDDDFSALCDEVVGYIPSIVQLETQIKQLHLNTANSRELTTSLETSFERLREQLNILSRQTCDISSEIIRGSVAPSAVSQPDISGSLVQEIGLDIKQRVGHVRDDLLSLITSGFKEAQNTVLAGFETTIEKTDAIYNAMALHYQEKQLGHL